MHPRRRLWIQAQRGPWAIFQTRYNPAASPTAAVGSAHRRGPCSCRLAGPPGATAVRPGPRRAYMGTPLLRLTPSPGGTPTAYTRSDAFGDAAELRFADSVARYSHADWKREQHADDVPRHDALRLYRTAVGSAARLLGVLPLAQASIPLRHQGAGG